MRNTERTFWLTQIFRLNCLLGDFRIMKPSWFLSISESDLSVHAELGQESQASSCVEEYIISTVFAP